MSRPIIQSGPLGELAIFAACCAPHPAVGSLPPLHRGWAGIVTLLAQEPFELGREVVGRGERRLGPPVVLGLEHRHVDRRL